MMSEENDIMEDLDLIDDMYVHQLVPRIVPDRSNPLEMFSSGEIKRQYRFSPDVITQILMPLIATELASITGRGSPLPPLLQLLIALRYYASGDLQRSCGGLENVTQPTVSKIIKRVSTALAMHVGAYVTFPEPEGDGLLLVKEAFRNIRAFPSVIGCIDGTHIHIANPSFERGEIFRNRKGRFSINVQVVGGPQLQIFDIVARWPGSAHDSRIFHNSNVKQRLENNELQGILLGDSGYPQLRYLYTPMPDPIMPARPNILPADPEYILTMFEYREALQTYRAQLRYNRAHKSTRNTVERLIGVWKRRFLCLYRQSSLKLQTFLRVITATAVLHNIAIIVHDDIEFGYDLPDDQPEEVPIVNNADGNMIRNAFINVHFR